MTLLLQGHPIFCMDQALSRGWGGILPEGWQTCTVSKASQSPDHHCLLTLPRLVHCSNKLPLVPLPVSTLISSLHAVNLLAVTVHCSLFRDALSVDLGSFSSLRRQRKYMTFHSTFGHCAPK